MKRLLSMIILLTITLSGLYAQAWMSQTVNIGEKHTDFEYTDRKDMNIYPSCGHPDIPNKHLIYKIKMLKSGSLYIGTCNSTYLKTRIRVYNENGYEIYNSDRSDKKDPECYTNDFAYLEVSLSVGIHYIAIEGVKSNPSYYNYDFLAVKIKGWLFKKGDEYDETINTHELGYKNNSFFYAHSEDTRFCRNNWGASSTGDLWYNFSLNVSMDIIVSNCGSSPKNYLLFLLKSNQTIDYRSFNSETCAPGSNDAFIHLKNLIPGYRYSVISEGYEEDGYMSTSILAVKGGVRDIGLKNEPFKFENNHSINGDDNLIVYKLTLQKDMSLKVLTNGTGTGNRIVELLDFEKARDIYDKYFKEGSTAPSEDKSNLNLDFLPAGTHFILIKGGQNGDNFTVKIEGDRLYPPGTNDNNYMQVRRYTKEQRNTYLDEITYIDGLGRPMQIVKKGITPSGNDLVGYQEYDEFGRESQNWLPVYLQGNNGAFVPLKKIANNVISTVYSDDQKPFTKTVYEASPLNRILEQYSPGQDWHDNKKAVRTAYKTNVSENLLLNCILYKAGGTNRAPVLSSSGNYATGLLYVTEVKDEDNNTSYEFKDKMGRIVLTRQMKGSETLDTYYVYNDYGNLCFVLPPLISTEGTGQAKLDLLAYQYKYDHRNRCIWKKLPGCEPVYYVYDKADRLIFLQDGEQRKKVTNNKSEWTFNKYDAFGRLIVSGIYKTAISHSDLQIKYKDVVFKEQAGSGSYGYSWNILSDTELEDANADVLLVNYYDDINYLASGHTDYKNLLAYNVESGYGVKHTSAKGLLVATRVKNIDSNGKSTNTRLGEIATAMYYDNRGRLIQTKSTNHLGGIEKEYIAYNFTGQPTQRKHIHSATGKTTQTEVYRYSYDHAGRPLKIWHRMNTGGEVLLVENVYDELGRVAVNKKGNSNTLRAAYTYNVRSWTKSITSPLFNQTLYYNDKVTAHTYSDYQQMYNGNISGMEWQLKDESKRSYRFKYDNLSRLTHAAYNGVTNGGMYNVAYAYDKHGNMSSLTRRGKSSAAADNNALIDQLSITYAGNQMIHVSDAVANFAYAESADFKDKVSTSGTIEYTYNANGAMNKDLNKGITEIQYNSLNLPRQMIINSPSVKAKNYYTYSASGVKLKTEQRYDPNYTVTPSNATNPTNDGLADYKNTDYVGNIIYETVKSGPTITNKTRILVDGGYYEGGVYYFYLTDHLGNNRVVAKADGTVIQKNHYYPFGMAFAENTTTEQGKQPYKYNGKELDQMHGLNMYDYSARFYEPGIGRFSTVDPLAEKYYSISPYTYVMNNPLKYIDPKGMSPEDGDPEKERRKREESAEKSIPIKQYFDLLLSNAARAALSFFSICERVTTPDGETYDKYTKRTYENSGPDYLGIGGSYNFYIGIPLISHGRDVSIGYVKNDGIVLVNSYRLGLGADISATGGLSIGYYNGDGKPTATSLAGFSYYVGGSYAGYGIGYSEDISYSRGNLYFGKNWTTISGSYGLGTPYGVNASVVWTDIPIYLYKSK